MRQLGRTLQLAGLTMPLVGLLWGLDRRESAMSVELGLLLGGVCIFLIGWKIQGGGESS